jgi:hypothetical protein
MELSPWGKSIPPDLGAKFATSYSQSGPNILDKIFLGVYLIMWQGFQIDQICSAEKLSA